MTRFIEQPWEVDLSMDADDPEPVDPLAPSPVIMPSSAGMTLRVRRYGQDVFTMRTRPRYQEPQVEWRQLPGDGRHPLAALVEDANRAE